MAGSLSWGHLQTILSVSPLALVSSIRAVLFPNHTFTIPTFCDVSFSLPLVMGFILPIFLIVFLVIYADVNECYLVLSVGQVKFKVLLLCHFPACIFSVFLLEILFAHRETKFCFFGRKDEE